MSHDCDYGCGRKATSIQSSGKHCCESHHSKCPAIRAKNTKGLLLRWEGKPKTKQEKLDYQKKWSKENPHRRKIILRRSRLKSRYGLNEDQFEAMRIFQDNCCACCGNKFKGKRPIHIDHCHKTGKVRGLLCNNCNAGLGLFHDNIEILQKAIDYLNKARS